MSETIHRQRALYVGIDVGTVRSAVAASNGMRETDSSSAGYPRAPARQAPPGEPFFGQEPTRSRPGLEWRRSTGRGPACPDEASRGELARHLQVTRSLVMQALDRAPARDPRPVYGVIGAPAQVSIDSKRLLVEATRGLLDAVMVCSEPFAVAYGLGMVDDALVVDIGSRTVELCRVRGTTPSAEDIIGLDTAGDWLDVQLFEELRRELPGVEHSIHQVKVLKERYAFVGDIATPVVAEFLVRGRPRRCDITKLLRGACRRIVPPIVKAIAQLVSALGPDTRARLLGNVLLAGGGSQIVDLDRMLEASLGRELGSGRVRKVDEPVYAGGAGALKLAQDMPYEYWRRLASTPSAQLTQRPAA